MLILNVPLSHRLSVAPNIRTRPRGSGGHVSQTSEKYWCLWCTYGFSTGRCVIPITKARDQYTGFGSFCSYNCAYTYLMKDHTGVPNVEYSLSLLHEMHKAEYGVYIDFKAMPHRVLMDKYTDGGLSIEDFRENLHVHDIHIVPKFPMPIVRSVDHEMRVTDYGSFSIKMVRT